MQETGHTAGRMASRTSSRSCALHIDQIQKWLTDSSAETRAAEQPNKEAPRQKGYRYLIQIKVSISKGLVLSYSTTTEGPSILFKGYLISGFRLYTTYGSFSGEMHTPNTATDLPATGGGFWNSLNGTIGVLRV